MTQENDEPSRPKPEFQILVQRGTYALDVTYAVMDCFDIATNSMNFGSGFLSTEEIHNLHALAVAIGADMSVFDKYAYGKGIKGMLQ